MMKHIKNIHWLKHGLRVAMLFVLMQSTLGYAQSMVHVRYTGTNKIDFNGMTTQQFYKKNCDVVNQQYKAMGKPSLAKPFKVTGSFKDLESYTEEVYISPEKSYHASYKNGYKTKAIDPCTIQIFAYQENTIVHYAQRSSYKFDSSLPSGEQWIRDELPGPTTSRVVGNTLFGLWGGKVKPTGQKDKIANLFCEIDTVGLGQKGELTGTTCTWRANSKNGLMFLGHPLELVLSSNNQISKSISNQVIADSVNLKAAYNHSVFQVPSAVKNMPFYPDEPNHTKPEPDDFDLDCKAEKKRTGIDPCSSPAALAKWCKAELEKTGEDLCNNDDSESE